MRYAARLGLGLLIVAAMIAAGAALGTLGHWIGHTPGIGG
jgi:hypothetical protein